MKYHIDCLPFITLTCTGTSFEIAMIKLLSRTNNSHEIHLSGGGLLPQNTNRHLQVRQLGESFDLSAMDEYNAEEDVDFYGIVLGRLAGREFPSQERREESFWNELSVVLQEHGLSKQQAEEGIEEYKAEQAEQEQLEAMGGKRMLESLLSEELDDDGLDEAEDDDEDYDEEGEGPQSS